MAVKFGKTWWGEHWLRSLENVDYENRLPRGASYARSGHVKEIRFNGNQIVAKVSGSRPRPYTVTLIIPPFSEAEIKKLMDGIVARPALISKLLNRELDPEILSIAEQCGLRVFPRRWTDFKMQCSCPDWAVPCKHLASVVYMISREIDNNPFLVFEIHNVNLPDELGKRGIFIPDILKTEIPSLASLQKTAAKKETDHDSERVYDRVDFSRLNSIAESLVLLLPDAPPFYSAGNFRDKFAAQFLRNVKQAQRLLSKKMAVEALYPRAGEVEAIGNRTTLFLTIDGDNRIEAGGDNHSCRNLTQLVPALFGLNHDRMLDYQPSVAALGKVLLASLHLIANGGVVPQIVRLDNKRYAIRWLPAAIDAEVRALVEKLAGILPHDLLRIVKRTARTERPVPLREQVPELLSVFLTELMARLSGPGAGDMFEDMFFRNASREFAGVGEQALSGGIKVWLDRFFLTKGDYRPVIEVDETEDGEFDVRLSVEETRKPDSLPVPVSRILRDGRFEKRRFEILRMLSLLSPFVRGLDTHVNTGGTHPIRFGMREFSPFLMEILPAIRLLDVKVLLPKSLQQILRPQTSVRLKKRSGEPQGHIRLDDLLSFDWQVALGEHLVSPEEFARLMKSAGGLFRFRERYIYAGERELEMLYKRIGGSKEPSPHELLQAALSEEYEGAPVHLTDEVRDIIRQLTSDEPVPLPAGVNARLRPYQQRGFSWMYRNSRIGFGSIIADDMGLGKTLQVITLLLKLKEEGSIGKRRKALVVVPTGLLTNWEAEIEKFAPELSTHIFHGAARDVRRFDADVMLTTYGVLRSDADMLKKLKWQVVVIDEAQNIKNPETTQAKAVKSIPATIRIAMSGTPVENRLSEFWSIMDFANKGYLGNIKSFKATYADPIQIFSDEKVVDRFRKVTAPFMMRRMKSDKSIISDLPDKVEQNRFAQLTGRQAALYEQTRNAAMDEIEGVEGADSASLFKRQGLVLQMILALKQICNHPANFLKNGQFDPTLSGKAELLLELVAGIVEAGEKVLIFTQFKEMGDMLQRFIAQRLGEPAMFYHGGCSVKERQAMVDRFQHNRADRIFILSLKAAGTGLNLTEASHVIHYDLWWNPAVENQATDRAYRIGQKKNVMVHRLITKNTFEEKIDEMIRRKKHLAEMTVATGESWIGKLSNSELRDIFE